MIGRKGIIDGWTTEEGNNDNKYVITNYSYDVTFTKITSVICSYIGANTIQSVGNEPFLTGFQGSSSQFGSTQFGAAPSEIGLSSCDFELQRTSGSFGTSDYYGVSFSITGEF